MWCFLFLWICDLMPLAGRLGFLYVEGLANRRTTLSFTLLSLLFFICSL